MESLVLFFLFWLLLVLCLTGLRWGTTLESLVLFFLFWLLLVLCLT